MTLDDTGIKSLREWLASWGEGPNWVDQQGTTVPISKATLTALLDAHERLRRALKEIRAYALDATDLRPRHRASIGLMADDALQEGCDAR